MKIETTKRQKFHVEIIDVWKDKPESVADFQKVAEKWARELIADTIASAIKTKKYFGDVIEVSVAVSIGDPTEDDEDNDLNDEEDE